jgi:geranylgeranyl diphosphate synthase type I
MNDQTDALGVFARAARGVDEAMDAALLGAAGGSTADMYQMLRYFLGFVEADGSTRSGGSGKRFRPALCLFLAEAYGVRDTALDAAAAIELFHNFTLIHDDIEDNDEYRRGRPTVWKVWGINHAINAGDVQSLLASRIAARAGFRAGDEALTDALLQAFIEVGEGQYMDFELASAPFGSAHATPRWYEEMIAKKSGALVGAAAVAAGVIAKKGEAECGALGTFGRELGTAYQMLDDLRSIADTRETTGKDTHSDVREHKRTLPVLLALDELAENDAARLRALYSLERQLEPGEIVEALVLIGKTGACAETRSRIAQKLELAVSSVEALSIPTGAKAQLIGFARALVAMD